MGKHEESGFERQDRDFYPTPAWVVDALAEHVDLTGAVAWEPACGDGRMAQRLRHNGCARVYCTDVVDRGCGLDKVMDFLSAQEPDLEHFDLICTNPPYGERGALMTSFIDAGLRRARRCRALLALLLPADCNSAKSRQPYFADCAEFTAKIVLTKRITWFERADGMTAAPKENSAWFVWSRDGRHIRPRRSPVIRYAPMCVQQLKLD